MAAAAGGLAAYEAGGSGSGVRARLQLAGRAGVAAGSGSGVHTGSFGAAGGGAGLERAQGAERLGQLLVDAGAVAGEGEQALQAGLGWRLLLRGFIQGRELEPAQALLAPQGCHQLGRPVPLEGVARAPVAGGGLAQLLQLARVLAGQRGEGTAAQAVAGAVPGGAGLAGRRWRGRGSGRRWRGRRLAGRVKGCRARAGSWSRGLVRLSRIG